MNKKLVKNILIYVPVVLVSFLVLSVAGLSAEPYSDSYGDNDYIALSSRWMKDIPSSRLISDINMPGAHDAGTNYCDLAYFSRCQQFSTREMLDQGIRYLDIRLQADTYNGKEALSMCHGTMSCRQSSSLFSDKLYLDIVLNDIYSFLEENPTETVLFAVKNENDSLTDQELDTRLNNYISENPSSWYTSPSIPALKDARGKIVLMTRYSSASGIDIRWGDQGDDDNSDQTYAIEEKNGFSIYIQDRYHYNIAHKWETFLDGLNGSKEKSASDLAIHFLSDNYPTLIGYGHPYEFAAVLNDYLMEEDLTEYGNFGIIAVDFACPQLCKMIYSTNTN